MILPFKGHFNRLSDCYTISEICYNIHAFAFQDYYYMPIAWIAIALKDPLDDKKERLKMLLLRRSILHPLLGLKSILFFIEPNWEQCQ